METMCVILAAACAAYLVVSLMLLFLVMLAALLVLRKVRQRTEPEVLENSAPADEDDSRKSREMVEGYQNLMNYGAGMDFRRKTGGDF